MTTITTTGRLTKDIELRKSEKGVAYVNFSLAVNEGFGDNQKTMFFECTIFNGEAERLVKAKAKKGSLISVVGKFHVEEFTRNNGEPGYSLKLTVLTWSYITGTGGQKDTNGGKDGSGSDNGNTRVQGQTPEEYFPYSDSFGTTNLDEEDEPF